MQEKPPETIKELLERIVRTQHESALLMTSVVADIRALMQVLRGIAPEHAPALDAAFATNRSTFAQELQRVTKQLELLRATVPKLVQ